MNYTEAREYLDNVSASGIILGLDSIRALMKELDNPQDDLRIVHIAGTNGKGSILSYTKNILMDAGYRVGCYSSPSVFGYLERFQIDGEWMAESEFPELVQKVKDAADRMTAKGLNHPTVFELETAIAFEYFKERNCDYVMLETGMGGDLDSTNVIKSPLVCAFASISMDHIGILGNTLREIATCKSGIIKPGAAVVTGPQDSEAMEVLEEAAKNMGCRITHTAECIREENSPEGQTFLYKGREYSIRLLGRHQLRNATVRLPLPFRKPVRQSRKRTFETVFRKPAGRDVWRSSERTPRSGFWTALTTQRRRNAWRKRSGNVGRTRSSPPLPVFLGTRNIRKLPRFSAAC